MDPHDSLPELDLLLDPDTPLPPGWTLIADGLPPLMPAVLKLMAAAATGWIFARGVADAPPALGWFYAGIAMVCAVYALRPGRLAMQLIGDRIAVRAGRWRRGLYLGPSHLLIWDGQTSKAFARSRVAGLDLRLPRRRITGKSPASPGLCTLTLGSQADPLARLVLPMVPAPSDERSPPSPALVAVQDWVAGREPSKLTRDGPSLRIWIRQLAVAHGVLLAITCCAMACTALIAGLFGIPAGALLGLLLGFPLCLGFPWLLQKIAGRYLAVGPDQRTLGWGYCMLLGIAAMILTIIGANLSGRLLWQLRATESAPLSISELAAVERRTQYFPWAVAISPSPATTGYAAHRRYLGDGIWVKSSYYVALLDRGRGCVWLGLQTDEGSRSRRSLTELLNARQPWLVPATGLESGGYAKAVEAARLESAGAIPG